MRFEVHGADRNTGEERVLRLDCATAQDARNQANAAGYLASQVIPIASGNTATRKTLIAALSSLAVIAATGVIYSIFLRERPPMPDSSELQSALSDSSPHLSTIVAPSPATRPAATAEASSLRKSTVMTIEEVRDFADTFAKRLERNVSEQVNEYDANSKDTVSARVTMTDLRQSESLLHPVVGAFALEMNTIRKSSTGSYEHTRWTLEVFDLTVGREDGVWKLLDGSWEVVTDMQLPDELTPSKEGQKGSALGDARLGSAFLQIEIDQREASD